MTTIQKKSGRFELEFDETHKMVKKPSFLSLKQANNPACQEGRFSGQTGLKNIFKRVL